MGNQVVTGYRRSSGRLGMRNRLLVVPTVICSAVVCDRIAAQISGAVSLSHQHGCSQAGFDVALTTRVLAGMALNPNVGAALVVSLGCEGIDGGALRDRLAESGLPASFISIQEWGGSVSALSAGLEEARRLWASAAEPLRVEGRLSDLVIGVCIGQPDGSAVVLENVIAAATERILSAGGTVIHTGRHGDLGYGAPPPRPGRWTMQAPAAHDVEALTGLAAAGANLIVYGTGTGTPVGSPIVPVLKVTASETAGLNWGDHIDLDLCGRHDPVTALIEAVLAAAGGRETAAEVLGHEEFAIHRIGLTL